MAVILALGSFASPSRWGLRLGAFVVVSLGFLVFEPKAHASGSGEGMVVFLLAGMIGAIGLGVLLRVGWEVWRHSGLVRAGRDAGALRAVDTGILALLGVWFGVLAFSRLGWLLGGVSWPLAVHGVVAGVAVALAYALIRFGRGVLQPLGLSATLILLFLVDYSALRSPAQVLSAVAEAAQEGPRCLMLGESWTPPQKPGELMAMTMAKGGPSALVLTLGQGVDLRLYRWSFRGRDFVPFTFYPAENGCTPHLGPLLVSKQLP